MDEDILISRFLCWLRTFAHDLINGITCVIMFIDSSDNLSDKEIMESKEMENVHDFFLNQINEIQLSKTLDDDRTNEYKIAIVKFSEAYWLKSKTPDEMYACCRILYMFQLLFSGEYIKEEIEEYINMFSVDVEVKHEWDYCLYLAVLCFINDENSDRCVTIQDGRLNFSRRIKLEKNIIRCFTDIILRKKVIFENNSLLIQ